MGLSIVLFLTTFLRGDTLKKTIDFILEDGVTVILFAMMTLVAPIMLLMLVAPPAYNRVAESFNDEIRHGLQERISQGSSQHQYLALLLEKEMIIDRNMSEKNVPAVFHQASVDLLLDLWKSGKKEDLEFAREFLSTLSFNRNTLIEHLHADELNVYLSSKTDGN